MSQDMIEELPDRSNNLQLQVEKIARELCRADGKDPDKIIAFSFTPPHILVWHSYRKQAEEQIKLQSKGVA